MTSILSRFLTSVLVSMSCACGTVVPQFEQSFIPNGSSVDDASKVTGFVGSIASHVQCEMRRAVGETFHDQGNVAKWLQDWSAKISLQIFVDEKSILAPNASLIGIIPSDFRRFSNGLTLTTPQTFSFGLGGSLSSDAQRTSTITWFLTFKELIAAYDFIIARDGKIDCTGSSPFFLTGDLKVKEGLYAGINTATSIGTVSDVFKKGGPLQVIEHHVTFEVDASGSLNPAWRLVNVTANTTGNLLTGNRNSKDDLLITMGPTQLDDTKRGLKPSPSLAVENQHLAAQIGQAVRNAVQGLQ